ncbi:twin-arginine translocase TatA/TatE family subunit [Saccharopolyspora rosea]|uniref:Twin-arginine translocase TatA/TatE family subunit n=1 Tax=Saccharopolyspora rosea TaxID=524884 RepID=A0ABW3FPV4_9PSEU
MVSVSLEHLAILLVAGFFILGPERLPHAAAWAGRALREVRAYAADAQQRLSDDLGDDYRRLREPLQQLNALRGFDPRRAATEYLLGADDQRPAPHGGPPAAPPPEPGQPSPFDAEAT